MTLMWPYSSWRGGQQGGATFEAMPISALKMYVTLVTFLFFFFFPSFISRCHSNRPGLVAWLEVRKKEVAFVLVFCSSSRPCTCSSDSTGTAWVHASVRAEERRKELAGLHTSLSCKFYKTEGVADEETDTDCPILRCILQMIWHSH